MSVVYRSASYRGVSSIAGGWDHIPLHSVFYPYASKSENEYSHGVCRITDIRSPFGTFGPAIMYPQHADYVGPVQINSTATFPLYKKNTTMILNIALTPYYIVTEDEPLYRTSDRTERYYTYANNGSTARVDALLSAGTHSNNYLLNVIDTSFVTTNTGPLNYYGFFAMLNALVTYQDRTIDYLLEHEISDALFRDYLLDKRLFYNRGTAGFPTGAGAVWRALPEKCLVETLLPERADGDIADVRDEIVEFLVKNMYSAYASLWAADTSIPRRYV